MGFDLKAEVDRAEFLDWIDNNKEKLISYLLLEEEDLLVDIYNKYKGGWENDN